MWFIMVALAPAIMTAFQSTESQKEEGKASSSPSGPRTWFALWYTLYLLRLQWPKPSHGLNWPPENVTSVLFSHEFNHTSGDLLLEEAEESEHGE